MHGDDVTRHSTARGPSVGIARTYQIVTLFGRDHLLHNVKLALLGRSPLRWRHWGQFASDRALSERAWRCWTRSAWPTRLCCRWSRPPTGRSGASKLRWGWRNRRRLLLLDEPLAGLSAPERATITELLAGIPREITIVMIEHDMQAALAFADRITLLHYGEVITERHAPAGRRRPAHEADLPRPLMTLSAIP